MELIKMININKVENESKWQLFYQFEEAVHKGNDREIKKILSKFNAQDFLNIPIIFDLVSYKKISLLNSLNKKGIPLIYEEDCGGNALHVACGADGNLEVVKFFVENNILTDIHKKSNKFGDTPLTLAISYEYRDIVTYFKKKFCINAITLEDIDIILDRIKVNFRR